MRRRSRQGFTLIELMVVVAILSVLAGVAIPSFALYVKRSKSAEAPLQLRVLFEHAATYYQHETAQAGLSGLHQVACTVGSVTNGIDDPNDTKQAGDYSAPEWRALGYRLPFGYYRYAVIHNGDSRCSVNPNNTSVYTMRAVGDLDDDNINSTFDLAVGSDEDNELYHSRSFRLINDYE